MSRISVCARTVSRIACACTGIAATDLLIQLNGDPAVFVGTLTRLESACKNDKKITVLQDRLAPVLGASGRRVGSAPCAQDGHADS